MPHLLTTLPNKASHRRRFQAYQGTMVGLMAV